MEIIRLCVVRKDDACLMECHEIGYHSRELLIERLARKPDSAWRFQDVDKEPWLAWLISMEEIQDILIPIYAEDAPELLDIAQQHLRTHFAFTLICSS